MVSFIFALYHAYLGYAAWISWDSAEDYCTDPKFMTLVTLLGYVVFALVYLKAASERFYFKHLARYAERMVFFRERSMER